MSQESTEPKKLEAIATDLGLSADLRIKALELLGKVGTQEALRILLDMAANEKLFREERELALKYAKDIIKSGR